ncbi:hypothetical protein C8Q79DRAFT_900112 [Trametes meyenii]|nr:hypothetical protein C8Q79DRAFT_900112 [Trametes meyenii]
MADSSRSIPRISRGQQYLFRWLWERQYPIIVDGVDDKLQGRWSPQAFAESHGDEDVLMIDSRLGDMTTKRVKAKHFFSEFVRTDISRGAVKLKDWPPSASFVDKFKFHYEAFREAIPMPSYTRDDGLYNIAAHFPVSQSFGCIKPDLVGPKMYLATRDVDGVGTTCLHLDATSAINLMVYNSERQAPGALWHIFMAQDVDLIRQYLRSMYTGSAAADPIHSQNVYLTPDMLADLTSLGVHPFVVRQNVSDAVFIPAGCPHQAGLQHFIHIRTVSNTAACIKIACDFLCTEGISCSAQVAEEFRQEKKEDILGLDLMLWHAWASLRQQNDRLHTSAGASVKTYKQCQRLKQRRNIRGQDDQARRHHAHYSKPPPHASSHTIGCPDMACALSDRTFRSLDGVFNHV